MPFTTAAVLAAAALIGLAILARTALTAWNGWLVLPKPAPGPTAIWRSA